VPLGKAAQAVDFRFRFFLGRGLIRDLRIAPLRSAAPRSCAGGAAQAVRSLRETELLNDAARIVVRRALAFDVADGPDPTAKACADEAAQTVASLRDARFEYLGPPEDCAGVAAQAVAFDERPLWFFGATAETRAGATARLVASHSDATLE
jgi:hypothetical protein